MSQVCLKCGYVRRPEDDDTTPSYECPKCGIVYSKAEAQIREETSKQQPHEAKPNDQTAGAPAVVTQEKIIAIRKGTLMAITGMLACLVIGYFIGREHLKYEIRQGLQNAFAGIGQALSGPVPTKPTSTPDPAREQPPQQEKPRPEESKPSEQPKQSPITAKLITKSYHEASFKGDDIQNLIIVEFKFINNLNRDLTAFTGYTVFKDLFDREISRVNLTYDDKINAGQEIFWKGTMKYNKFLDKDQRLRAAELKDINVDFVTQKVIYTDGTKESFQE